MSLFVVDASVAVKWFVPEIHSNAAARLLDPDIVLCAPDLIGPELANALWKKVRRGEITEAEADEILQAFEALPLETYASISLLRGAVQLAVALDRSAYDSLYLALAVANDCPLITADRKFYSTIAPSSLAAHIRWVEDPL
ncbi:MAG TPA: type II toxin-antitoxin system VapC family toxin [Thermoanaerobaculia bacterium]|nr:type II toxin-antitoxin system VapC family toxin [Thermoanaerobaculia bacterium]